MAKNFGPNLACLTKIRAPKFFWEDLPLLELDIVPSYHLRHFTETVINQTCKNDKKTNFGPEFGLFWATFGLPNFFLGILPLLDVVNCCKLSLHAILRKANESNLKTWQKIVLGMILAPLKFLVKIWTPNIFL